MLLQTVKLEGMEKKAGNAEGEVSALRGRLILLQENSEKQEERLCKATLGTVPLIRFQVLTILKCFACPLF